MGKKAAANKKGDTSPTDEAQNLADEGDEPIETAGNAFVQVVIGAVVLGALTALYIWSAQTSHEAEMLVVDATEMTNLADLSSLTRAEAKLQEALEVQSGNDYAIAAMAETAALRWVLHGVDDAQGKAQDFTQNAVDDDIQRADRYAAEALLALGGNNPDKAIEVVSAVVEKGGVSEKLYWVLGRAQLAKGQTKLARDNFRRAQDSSTGAPHYTVDLGDAYDDEGDARNAALFWAMAAKDNSNYVPAVARALVVRIRKGENPKALFEELTRLEAIPAEERGKVDNAYIAFAKGELHYFAGDAKKSLAAATKSIELAGESSRRLELKARGLFATKKPKLAVAALEQARAKSPRSERYFYALADGYRDAGIVGKALALLAAEKTVYSVNSSYHVAVGKTHGAKGDHDAARVAYAAALKINEKSASALLNDGISLWRLKKYDDATKQLEKAVNARRNYPQIYETIGLMWIEQGAASDGNKQLEQADKLFRAKGTDAFHMRAFYARIIKKLAAHRGSSMISAWQAREKALGAS